MQSLYRVHGSVFACNVYPKCRKLRSTCGKEHCRSRKKIFEIFGQPSCERTAAPMLTDAVQNDTCLSAAHTGTTSSYDTSNICDFAIFPQATTYVRRTSEQEPNIHCQGRTSVGRTLDIRFRTSKFGLIVDVLWIYRNGCPRAVHLWMFEHIPIGIGKPFKNSYLKVVPFCTKRLS